MDTDSLVQVGIGGMLAVLLLREVFGFLSTWNEKKKHTHTPSQSPQPERPRVPTQGEHDILLLLERQTSILEELRTVSARQLESMIHLRHNVDQLMVGQEKASVNMHQLRDKINEMTLRIVAGRHQVDGV